MRKLSFYNVMISSALPFDVISRCTHISNFNKYDKINIELEWNCDFPYLRRLQLFFRHVANAKKNYHYYKVYTIVLKFFFPLGYSFFLKIKKRFTPHTIYCLNYPLQIFERCPPEKNLPITNCQIHSFTYLLFGNIGIF